MSTAVLTRQTFETSRLLEFFTEKELRMQIGHPQDLWPIALVKELIDNSLDACESAGTPPEIHVECEADSVTVADNGPGLSPTTFRRSLDYLVRVSDKAHYISPTRGQLGNALKCVWAAPFVTDGERGLVEVSAGGVKYSVEVTLDRIGQKPQLSVTESASDVKIGTRFTIHWPKIASSLNWEDEGNYYITGEPATKLRGVLENYHAFNPHARFTYRERSLNLDLRPTAGKWTKWLPSYPTSPHWYSAARLSDLIAAYIAGERDGRPALSVGRFISEFDGLRGTAKQRDVAAAAGLTGAMLSDLVEGGNIAAGKVRHLLNAMRAHARPVKPQALGVIGETHLTQVLENAHGAEAVKYRRVADTESGLPFVVEAACGVTGAGRIDVIGLNWTPVLKQPFPTLPALLSRFRLDVKDEVVILLHIACPLLGFTDRGKGFLELGRGLATAIESAVKAVSKHWTQQKRSADRENRVSQQALEKLRRASKPQTLNITEAADQVMADAYMKASANNTLPANARQIMYAARPAILELTGGEIWSKSSYFTQTLLPNFLLRHPQLTADWDVVFDARGRLTEPHTGVGVELGTLGVRSYLAKWGQPTPIDFSVNTLFPTAGPDSRYRFALFIEKEGFNSLLRSARIAERYDLAIMSTKGMSVTASRSLVEALSERGVTILVARDFDKAGFSIVHTLKTDTRRYQFKCAPRVFDLGLRLSDAQALGLESERVEYECKVDPRVGLSKRGATEEECEFLVTGRVGVEKWAGERVELNAMPSRQFIDWLEQGLKENGVEKVVPGEDVLADAYRRAVYVHRLNAEIEAASERLKAESVEAPLPENLASQIAALFEQDASLSWDAALANIVSQK